MILLVVDNSSYLEGSTCLTEEQERNIELTESMLSRWNSGQVSNLDMLAHMWLKCSNDYGNDKYGMYLASTKGEADAFENGVSVGSDGNATCYSKPFTPNETNFLKTFDF